LFLFNIKLLSYLVQNVNLIIIDIYYLFFTYFYILYVLFYILFIFNYYTHYLKARLEKEAMEKTHYRELLEQERRDHELAVRLAQESNGQVEDSPPPVRR